MIVAKIAHFEEVPDFETLRKTPWTLRSTLKLLKSTFNAKKSYADCLDLVISAQFTLEMCAAVWNRKNN